MVGTVWLEERMSVCERSLIVWRWTCSTHAGSGLWWGCGGMSSTLLHGFWCWPVYYWWTSGWGRSKFLGEWASLRTGVVGVFWPLPTSGPLSTHTSSSSCHTPVIEWEWLVIFYLIDIFHVVYKVICVPSPISLVLHLDRPILQSDWCVEIPQRRTKYSAQVHQTLSFWRWVWARDYLGL